MDINKLEQLANTALICTNRESWRFSNLSNQITTSNVGVIESSKFVASTLNDDSEKSKILGQYLTSVSPSEMLELVARLRLAEQDAARYRYVRAEMLRQDSLLARGDNPDELACKAFDVSIDERIGQQRKGRSRPRHIKKQK